MSYNPPAKPAGHRDLNNTGPEDQNRCYKCCDHCRRERKRCNRSSPCERCVRKGRNCTRGVVGWREHPNPLIQKSYGCGCITIRYNGGYFVIYKSPDGVTFVVELTVNYEQVSQTRFLGHQSLLPKMPYNTDINLDMLFNPEFANACCGGPGSRRESGLNRHISERTQKEIQPQYSNDPDNSNARIPLPQKPIHTKAKVKGRGKDNTLNADSKVDPRGYSLEPENDMKRTSKLLVSSGITKSDPEFKQFLDVVYRGTLFALRVKIKCASFREDAREAKIIERIVKAHIPMYLSGRGIDIPVAR